MELPPPPPPRNPPPPPFRRTLILFGLSAPVMGWMLATPSAGLLFFLPVLCYSSPRLTNNLFCNGRGDGGGGGGVGGEGQRGPMLLQTGFKLPVFVCFVFYCYRLRAEVRTMTTGIGQTGGSSLSFPTQPVAPGIQSVLYSYSFV